MTIEEYVAEICKKYCKDRSPQGDGKIWITSSCWNNSVWKDIGSSFITMPYRLGYTYEMKAMTEIESILNRKECD